MSVLVCIPTNSVRGFPLLLSWYFIGCGSGLGRFRPRLLPPTLPDVCSLMVHHWKVYRKVKRRKHFHTLHWGVFAVHQLCEGNPTTTTCPEKSEDLFTQPTGSGHLGTAQAQHRERSHRRTRAAGKSSRQQESNRGRRRKSRRSAAGPRRTAGQREGCREGTSEAPRKPGPGRDEGQETQEPSAFSWTQDSPS